MFEQEKSRGHRSIKAEEGRPRIRCLDDILEDLRRMYTEVGDVTLIGDVEEDWCWRSGLMLGCSDEEERE